MQATLTKVDLNSTLTSKAGKTFTVARIGMRNEKGKDVEYIVFTNTELYSKLSEFSSGDKVDAIIVNEKGNWNLKDIIATATNSNNISNSSNASTSYSSSNKDVDIRRAVALKAAVDFVKESPVAPSTTDDVIRTAIIFEKYLENGTLVEDVSKGMTGEEDPF